MQKKTKILYVITKGTFGGAQRYVFDLATSLPQGEFEVTVIVGEDGLLTKKLATRQIKTETIPALQRDLSFLKEIRSFFSLYACFRKSRPDIVHLNSSKAGGLGALAARIAGVKKIVFTAHGWPFNEQRGFVWRIGTWCASYATALLATDIITIASKEYAQAKAMPFIAGKTHCIHNGVPHLPFLSREEAREKLGLRKDTLVVGSVGELTWNKNYPELVSIAGKLMGERLDFDLAVIGEGEDRAEITRRAKESPILDGRIQLLGFKEDAYTYLKAFDIFALNSRKEGLPYVLLEAGMAGLPVVATAVGGIPDIITDGETGLLATPARTMEDALRKLLTKKETREKLGSALKTHVEQTFSFEVMLQKTLQLYRS